MPVLIVFGLHVSKCLLLRSAFCSYRTADSLCRLTLQRTSPLSSQNVQFLSADHPPYTLLCCLNSWLLWRYSRFGHAHNNRTTTNSVNALNELNSIDSNQKTNRWPHPFSTDRPVTWNSQRVELWIDITDSKNKLKTHLFQLAFDIR